MKFANLLAVATAGFVAASLFTANLIADTIKIGHYGSLTGAQATFGLSTSHGVKMAIDEFNAAGGLNGKKVELVEYDTKGEPREATTVVTRLVNSDKVVAVIGEVASSISLAGAPICQQNQVPMISPSSTNPRVTLVGDFIFRVCFIDPFQGLVGAKFARENLKADTAAILVDQQNAYSVGLAEVFNKNFTDLGGKIVETQVYAEGESDFTPKLVAIRAANPKVIYVPGYYTDVANIAIQARKLGITAPLLGGDGWDSAKLTEIGGAAIEGSYFSNHASDQDPAMAEFVKKYEEIHGTAPDALAALGYDAANLLFDAMKRSPTLQGPALRDAIAGTQNFVGVTGTINFNATRDAVKPAVILEVKDGKPTYVVTVKP
jgi:branched-chain amino acid transport system substrate-binding protein